MLRKTLQVHATGSDAKNWMLFVDVDGSATVYRDGSAFAKLGAIEIADLYRGEGDSVAKMKSILTLFERKVDRKIDPKAQERFIADASWLDGRFG